MIFLLIIFTFLLIGYIGTKIESKSFNSGLCPKCNTKFKHFDTDSQGGRGYKCNNQHYTWVSYPWIDRNFNA